eukprot:s1254_g10.t1
MTTAFAVAFNAVLFLLPRTCLDRRRDRRNIQQSELEMRRLKSLVRWSAERFADEDDPEAAVQHMEMVVLEFRPIADIALASKNARKTLHLLDSWAARRSMMRQVWVYMDNILMNWKHLTQAEFFRSMWRTQLVAMVMPIPRDSAYNPPVELPSSSASNFFEEAAAGAKRSAEEAECRRRFDRFATKPGNEPDFLSFQDFTRLMEHYEASATSNLVTFFYAIDRNRDDKVDFQEFFLGSTAADPQTVHILNSFTGKERAAFTFDFYDANRSGFLELEEFQKVCRDCAIVSLDDAQLRRHTFDKAMELGLMQERRGRIMDEEQSFMPPSQSQFYEFISSERLRGTSRLFRFGKSLIKPPRHLRRLDTRTRILIGWVSTVKRDLETLLPYTDLLPAAPDSELELDSQKGLSEARNVASEVLKGLSHPTFKEMAPPADGSFALATADDICGLCALHGQMWDLLSHFKWHLPPVMDMCYGDIAYMRYLFLGDYCDRGSHNLEVLTILLALKVLNRDKVFLLRGHHENRHVNYHLGLREECVRRLGQVSGMEVYEQLNRTFEHMSLAALDQLKKYKKPLYLPHPLHQRPSEKAERLNEQVLLELFTPSDLLPPELGCSSEREGDQVKAFCAAQKLNIVVASRQIPPSGFAYDPSRPQTSQQNPSRWPLQERAPTPGRFRELKVHRHDPPGRQSLPVIHVLEDQAVATVEDRFLQRC